MKITKENYEKLFEIYKDITFGWHSDVEIDESVWTKLSDALSLTASEAQKAREESHA